MAYCLTISCINCLEPWCKNYFEGFSLNDDYNRNSPPLERRNNVEGKFKKFILKTKTTLWDVDEVSCIVSFIHISMNFS